MSVLDQQKTTGGFNMSGWYDKRVWDSQIYSPQKGKLEMLSFFFWASSSESFLTILTDFRMKWSVGMNNECASVIRYFSSASISVYYVCVISLTYYFLSLKLRWKLGWQMEEEITASMNWNFVAMCVLRCYVWCGHALPVRVSLEETTGAESFDPKCSFPDAA